MQIVLEIDKTNKGFTDRTDKEDNVELSQELLFEFSNWISSNVYLISKFD